MDLRQHKKQQTREALQAAALRLFAEHGYEATSCEDVARAAGVSPATLFRYFASKEDLVLHDVYDPVIAEAVRARPAGEPPLTAVRRALVTMLAGTDPEEMAQARQRTALLLSVPTLRARIHEQLESLVRHLAPVLAARSGLAVEDADVEVAATMAAAAVSLAVERWARDGGELADHVDRALGSAARVDRLGEPADAAPDASPTGARSAR